jgi:N-acetylglucosamine kinase-like BadF-type ATPase
MKPEFVVVVDGGASRTRCAVLTRDGRRIGYSESGASNFYGSNSEQTSLALTTAVDGALKSADVKATDAACVTAGMASVHPNGDGTAEVDPVLGRLGFARRMVLGDMIIAHAGALDRRAGVLVIAGTGSSCIGIAPDGRQLKIGGWGPVFGDEGSGYHIGRMALNAAGKAYDGVGPTTSLVEIISQALSAADFHQALKSIYKQQFSVMQMASLAKEVQRAAAAGDVVAGSILAVAADDLAALAISVLQRLFVDDTSPLVSFAGSLLVSCEPIRTRFADRILRAVPNAQVIPPRYPPYIGAFLLACAKLGWLPAPDVSEIVEISSSAR